MIGVCSIHMMPFPFGKYTIIERIGAGGMAEVYRAISIGPDGFEKEVAIKKIHPHLSKNSEFISMFITEAKISALLNHNNIVNIFELGYFNDQYYICMDYVWGKDLWEFMKKTVKKEPLDSCLGMYIISEVCKGLDYAHRKTDLCGNPLNIVHRDISPQNILISFEGEIKITDFGIAKVALRTKDTALGILKGKLDYMSPEQLLFKPVDRRSDIYSAGVILYELITGKRPYENIIEDELIEVIKKGFPKHLLDDLEQKNKEAARIIRKATAKDPADRYESCKEFYEDIRRYLLTYGNDDYQHKLSQLMKDLFSDEFKKRIIDTSVRKVVEPTRIADMNRQKRSLRKSKIIGFSGIIMLLCVIFFASYMLFNKGKTEYFGSIKITSNPTDVDVFLNDRLISKKTPIIIENIPADKQHEIILKKEGYSEERKKITLSQGEMKEFNFDLKTVDSQKDIREIVTTIPNKYVKKVDTKKKGAAQCILRVNTDPEGAKVYINGNYAGESPVEISAFNEVEKYNVLIKKDGYKDWKRTVSMGNDRILSLQIKLEPSFGHLSINAIPWAEVIIDGKGYGETPLINLKLQTGTHKILLVNKNLNVQREMEIKIDEDGHVKKVVDLFERAR